LRRAGLGQRQTGTGNQEAGDQEAGGFSAEHFEKGHGRDLSAGVLFDIAGLSAALTAVSDAAHNR
jgi:hypothetical protein